MATVFWIFISVSVVLFLIRFTQLTLRDHAYQRAEIEASAKGDIIELDHPTTFLVGGRLRKGSWPVRFGFVVHVERGSLKMRPAGRPASPNAMAIRVSDSYDLLTEDSPRQSRTARLILLFGRGSVLEERNRGVLVHLPTKEAGRELAAALRSAGFRVNERDGLSP